MARPKAFDVEEALEAAMEAFWAHGYEATSVNDLTRAMGVQKASLYATYGDKHRLFLATLERYGAHEREILSKALAGGSPKAAIASVFAAATACPDPDSSRRGCFVVNAAAEVGPHDVPAAEVLRRHVAGLERLFADAVARARSRGEIAEGVAPLAIARALVAALYGIAVLKKIDPRHPRLEAAAAAAMGLLDARRISAPRAAVERRRP